MIGPTGKNLNGKKNSHTAAEAMLNELYSNANYQRGEQRRQVESADKATVAVQTKWTQASSKPPESMPEYIKTWISSQQHKLDTGYKGAPQEGMVLYQFIPSGPGKGSFIMNYVGKDKIFPIYFVQDDQRVPNFLYPFSKSLSDIHPVENISYGEWWNKKSIETNKEVPVPFARFEPILKIWSTPEVFSLQHTHEYEREAKGQFNAQQDVDMFIAQQRNAYKEEKHLVIQPVLFDPFGGEATRIDSPDETKDNKEIIVPVDSENKEIPVHIIHSAAVDDIKVETVATTDSIALQPTEAMTEVKRAKKDEGVPQSNQSGGGQNVDVSMHLGPPRNYISRKTIVIPFDRIIRNIHFNDFMNNSSITMGTWTQRKALTPNVDSSFNIYDPHGYFRLVAASCIPLDIPSMGLDKHAIWQLRNTNFTRLKCLGGKIELNGFRFMENDINNNAIKYVSAETSPVSRKIMWKMFDRERDYSWSYVNATSQSLSSSVIEFDTAKQTDLKANNLIGSGFEIGNLPGTWLGKGTFPQLVHLSEHGHHDENDAEEYNYADSFYASMQDHPISKGSLEFPIMGWPKWVLNANNIKNKALPRNVYFNTGRYSTEGISNVEDQLNISFVNSDFPTMAQCKSYMMKLRAGKLASTYDATDKKFKFNSTMPTSLIETFPSITDFTTSSHVAAIHIPQYCSFDGVVKFSSVSCDMKISGAVELDLTTLKNSASVISGMHGEYWEDTIDPNFNIYGGSTLFSMSGHRAQWQSKSWQYINPSHLKLVDASANSAVTAIEGMFPSDNGDEYWKLK